MFNKDQHYFFVVLIFLFTVFAFLICGLANIFSIRNRDCHYDCQSILKENPHARDGDYQLCLNLETDVRAFCEFSRKEEERSWIVIQRRVNHDIRFDQIWYNYRFGFGDMYKDFWFGNENLHKLTKRASMYIRFETWDYKNVYKFADYANFSVLGLKENFRLYIGSFQNDSTNKDFMSFYDGQEFSTKDIDNDKSDDISCSGGHGYAGWWFANCAQANPNGMYLTPGEKDKAGMYFDADERMTVKMTQIKVSYNL